MDEIESRNRLHDGKSYDHSAIQVMWAAFVQEMIKAEPRKAKEALGHEPTEENWQDYYDLRREQKVKTEDIAEGSR